jgi:hypothetical protein
MTKAALVWHVAVFGNMPDKLVNRFSRRVAKAQPVVPATGMVQPR